MTSLIIILASGIAAYGPPSSYDAYEAITNRILVDLYERGDVLREENRRNADDFPSDVVIHRCAKKNHRATRTDDGVVRHLGGFNCAFEIFPNARPSYRIFGFFRYNGFEWEYHGPLRETRLPGPSAFDSQHGAGEPILKPGSVAYEGDPRNPLNPDYNPYSDLLGRSGEFDDVYSKY